MATSGGISTITKNSTLKIITPISTATGFDSSTQYKAGDYCYRNGFLYKCTETHIGTWNAAHFTQTTIGAEIKAQGANLQSEIDDVKSDLNNSFTFDASKWVLGTLNPGTGGQGPSTTRIVSPYVSAVKNDVIQYEGNTNCLIVYEFDSSKAWISDSAWTDGNIYKVTNANTKYIRILIRKDSTNTTINTGDISELVSNVKMLKIIPQSAYDSDETISAIDKLNNYFNVSDPVFTSGYYINYTDGSIVPATGYSYATADVSNFNGGKLKGKTAVPPNTVYGLAFYDFYDNYIAGEHSTNTGMYDFEFNVDIPDNAKWVRITLRDANSDMWQDLQYPFESYFENGQKNTPILETVKENEVLHKTLNAKHVINNSATALTLLHFSDLHADKFALSRIKDYANKISDIIDDAICTGDMVSNTAEQIASWWDENVLTCIGNHDSASYDSVTGYDWTALSMADRDAYYIAPFESEWDITHTSGTSYYYKDYTSQKVRLIVMDGMLYVNAGTEATAQTTWLEGLLADAITNNLHVLIAIHAPHGGAEPVECSFTRYGQTTMPTNADCNTPQDVIDTVATAITNGLHFIGYIVGHTHQDNIWDAENDGSQLMYCVTCAAQHNVNQWKNSDQDRTYADAYNLVTIDTANTLIKIVRGGGADIDDHMRTRKAICFNYTSGTVVGEIL